MRRLAIIGGTGVYDALMLENAEVFSVTTRYGSALLKKALTKRRKCILARHGAEHSIPRTRLTTGKYAALVKLDVTRIIATAAVGSLNADCRREPWCSWSNSWILPGAGEYFFTGGKRSGTYGFYGTLLSRFKQGSSFCSRKRRVDA